MRPAAEGDAARLHRSDLAPRHAQAQRVPLALGLTTSALVAVNLAAQGWRRGALWAIGLPMGLALYHAAFGFVGGYRRTLVARDMRGVQAQLPMLALASVLFAPVLAAGSAFGQAVGGAWATVGLSVAAGAFLFSVGMQLAGGCGSGTLYTAGGGSLRMGVVLVAACAGLYWASLHLGWWQQLPSHGPVVPGQVAGWPLATAGQLALIAVLSLLLRQFATRPAVLVETAEAAGPRRWRRAALTCPWSLAVGAVVLALCNLAILLVAGHPWSITWGFTLWGAKAAAWLGWQPASSRFWSGGWPNQAPAGDILADTTSMMDLAVMLGALCAAAAAGRFAVLAHALAVLRLGPGRRPGDRLRRTHRLRLQHRRLHLRRRLRQRARPAVDRRRAAGQLGRRRPAAPGRLAALIPCRQTAGPCGPGGRPVPRLPRGGRPWSWRS